MALRLQQKKCVRTSGRSIYFLSINGTVVNEQIQDYCLFLSWFEASSLRSPAFWSGAENCQVQRFVIHFFILVLFEQSSQTY